MSETINRCVRCKDKMPSFRVNTLCEECYAEGWENDYDDEAGIDDVCPICDGSGEAPYYDGTNYSDCECDYCSGTGVTE